MTVRKKEYLHDILAEYGDVPVVVQDYTNFLLQKISIGKLIYKGARTNLRTALAVYTKFKLKACDTPTQKQIERYAKQHPAARKKLVSFVCFLNNHHNCGLILKTYPSQPKKRAKTSVLTPLPKDERLFYQQQFMALSRIEQPLTREQKIQWIIAGIAYFHEIQVQITKLSQVKIGKQLIMDELMLVKYKGFDFALPSFG